MLLLAYLLTLNPAWRNHPIRLVFSVPEEGDAARAEEQLTRLTTPARVKAALEIVSGGEPVAELRRRSQGAALVQMGFEPPPEEGESAALEQIRPEIGDLPRVILVNSAGGISLVA